MNENNVIITGYKPMEFPNTQTGEIIDMVKVTYFSAVTGKDAVGYLPLQSSYVNENKKEIMKMINRVPALYSVNYGMVPGKNNKPTLEVTGFTFIKDIDFKSLFIK
jgi:hypothetical protein